MVMDYRSELRRPITLVLVALERIQAFPIQARDSRLG